MPNYISDEARVSTKAILEEPVSVRGRTVIRENSFIGSFTLINEDTTIHAYTTIEKYCSIGKKVELGVPATITGYRFNEETISKLLALKWWDLDYKLLHDIEFDNIEKAIEQLEELRQREDFQYFKVG